MKLSELKQVVEFEGLTKEQSSERLEVAVRFLTDGIPGRETTLFDILQFFDDYEVVIMSDVTFAELRKRLEEQTLIKQRGIQLNFARQYYAETPSPEPAKLWAWVNGPRTLWVRKHPNGEYQAFLQSAHCILEGERTRRGLYGAIRRLARGGMINWSRDAQRN